MNDAVAPQRPYRFIGKPLPRKEDERLITGKGRFTDDFNLDGQAYAAMVRSPHPHARIVAIDTAAAKNMPGVLGVFTGADCAADGLEPIPHDPVPKTKYDMKLTGPGGGAVFVGPHILLPADKVRHVGEAVAMVVAETQSAGDGCRRSRRGRLRGTAVRACTPKTRCSPARRRCGTRRRDNMLRRHALRRRGGDRPRPSPRAAHVVAMEFHIGRVTGVPIEPRAALGALRRRRPAATRSMPAPAARCGRRASLPRCSALRPTSCACCPTTSAAISARATASLSNSAWCCGRRGSSAVR